MHVQEPPNLKDITIKMFYDKLHGDYDRNFIFSVKSMRLDAVEQCDITIEQKMFIHMHQDVKYYIMNILYDELYRIERYGDKAGDVYYQYLIFAYDKSLVTLSPLYLSQVECKGMAENYIELLDRKTSKKNTYTYDIREVKLK